MRKAIIFLLFLLALGHANAAVINEATLAELGYGGFSISGTENRECAQYTFAQTGDLNNAIYPVFSLHANFSPVSEGDAGIVVYLNQGMDAIAELGTGDFGNGWARIPLPRESIGERNVLEVCGTTSFQITQIDVLNDSKIGNYLMADFPVQGAFTKIIAIKEPKIGEEFPIIVTLLNYGSENADIYIRYRRETLDEAMPEIQVFREHTSLRETIPKCRERDSGANCIVPGEATLEYTVKATRAVQMTMLPAILEYDNIFGDGLEMESNRQTIRVTVPEIKVMAFVSSERDTLKVGEGNKLTISVKNDGKDTLRNISVSLQLQGGLNKEGPSNWNIASIMPDESIEFDFTATANTPGQYKIGCGLAYPDYDVAGTECDTATITYEGIEIDPAIIAAGALLGIGIIVYAYFMLKK